MIVVLSLALTICGCVCLYFASPNQQWLPHAPTQRPLLVAGGLLVVAGLAAWITVLRPLDIRDAARGDGLPVRLSLHRRAAR